MFPLNIGFVAAFAKKIFGEKIDIQLFKFPQDFMDQVKKEKPDVVGFSKYIWSADINKKLSDWIKSLNPDIITVFGGPDFNSTAKGREKFFRSHKNADFYIPYQGETPFANLIQTIFDKNFIDLKSEAIDGVISYNRETNETKVGALVPRIKDPNEIPSPYLTGIFHKFFSTKLIPIVESNRGCPYTCTFCAQGKSSHNRMEFFDLDRVKKELDYLAEKTNNTNILMFADSNFGIVERDLEIAKYIADLKKTNGYPHKFTSNWAKNQPKIYEIARILNNVNLVISLQSLDPLVLKNIKRQNIQLDVFKQIIDRVNDEGGISGTEIILGLPGETKQSHLQTIRTLFDWDVSYIICYIGMMLDGSDLSLAKETGEFPCKTKYRFLDNGFGKYDSITSIEYEEGIRETPTMSEQEMLFFRPVHWIIQFLWNYRFGFVLLKYLQKIDINPLDFVLEFVNQISEEKAPEKIKKIYDDFQYESDHEWFDTVEQLHEHFVKNVDSLEEGKYGKLNGKYIFRVLLEAKDDFEKCLYLTALSFEQAKPHDNVIKDLVKYISDSIIDFTKDWDEITLPKTINFKHNILSWKKSRYKQELNDINTNLVFYLPDKQKDALQVLLRQYEHKNKNVTLRKMSEFMDTRDCFLKVK